MDSSPPYCLITPGDLHWRPSNRMRIPNADYLERTGSPHLGARLWRLPPGSANTLHRHLRSEEFYFVLEDTEPPPTPGLRREGSRGDEKRFPAMGLVKWGSGNFRQG